MDIFEYYGLKPMGFGDVCNLPDCHKAIRNAKVDIIDKLADIRQYAEALIEKVRNGAEGDDEHLIELYAEILDNVDKAKESIIKAYIYNERNGKEYDC